LEDELTLLHRARALDQDALAQIHERYYIAVFRYIDYRVQDMQTVEDLTSEVFIRFLNAIRDRHAPQNSIQGWLIGVAKNVLKEYYRQNHRDNWSILEDEQAGSAPSPAEVTDTNLMNEQLRKAMQALTEDQQQVLALRFGFGMPISQVSKAMQKSEGAIKMLQARAVAHLTQILQSSGVNA
jgi:RNA polymerase sigma-70 factor (ECF subfamily)